MSAPGVAFYTVADQHYFLGAVAMLNSLRLSGHREPLRMLDCGLRAEQRELLGPHVELVERSAESLPFLLKTILPLELPAELTVLIDADIIVTRSLRPVIERAGEGRLVAFRNRYERFVPEWGELLDLGPTRRRATICSALVALGGECGRETLRLMDAAQRRVERDYRDERGNFDAAFLTLDQDVLNAVLCTRTPADRIVALEHRLAPDPPFESLRLLDEALLRCAYPDGTEPYVLHHLGRKPWLEPMRRDLYSRLLVRLLRGPGLEVRVPDDWLPLRFRAGLAGGVERARVGARDRLGWLARDVVPARLISRIDAARERRRAGAAGQ